MAQLYLLPSFSILMYSFLRSPSFSFKQDRQCKHNVILWHVHVTSVAVEKQECLLYVWLSYMSQQHENRMLHKSVFMANLCPRK